MILQRENKLPARHDGITNCRSWLGAYGASAVAHVIAFLVVSTFPATSAERFQVAGTNRVQTIEIRVESVIESSNATVSIKSPPILRQPQPPEPSPSSFSPRVAVNDSAINVVRATEATTENTAINLPEFHLARQAKQTVPEFVAPPLPSPVRVRRTPVLEQRAGYEKAADLSRNPPPEYPPAAIQQELQGAVLLRLLIDEQGVVRAVKLLESSGHDLLDNAAIRAVKNWTGTPAERDGRPVETLEVLPIRFRL